MGKLIKIYKYDSSLLNFVSFSSDFIHLILYYLILQYTVKLSLLLYNFYQLLFIRFFLSK